MSHFFYQCLKHTPPFGKRSGPEMPKNRTITCSNYHRISVPGEQDRHDPHMRLSGNVGVRSIWLKYGSLRCSCSYPRWSALAQLSPHVRQVLSYMTVPRSNKKKRGAVCGNSGEFSINPLVLPSPCTETRLCSHVISVDHVRESLNFREHQWTI